MLWLFIAWIWLICLILLCLVFNSCLPCLDIELEFSFDMFFSWFSILIFSLISKSANDYQNPFLKNPKLVYIFIKSRSVFFMITELVCIFIKYRFVFFWSQNWFVFSLNIDLNFFQPQNWYVFYLNTDLNFFLKFFSF